MEITTAHSHPVLMWLVILSLVLNVVCLGALFLIYKKLLPVLEMITKIAPMLEGFAKMAQAQGGMMQKAKDAMRKMGIG